LIKSILLGSAIKLDSVSFCHFFFRLAFKPSCLYDALKPAIFRTTCSSSLSDSFYTCFDS